MFGHLKVIQETKNNKGEKAWLCECDCKKHTQITIDTYRLTSGAKRHCGCLKGEKSELPEIYKTQTQICNTCNIKKLLTEFYYQEKYQEDGTIKYYFAPRCKKCDLEKVYADRKANPKKRRKWDYKDFEKPERQIYFKELTKKRRENGKYLAWQRSEAGKESSKRAREKRKLKEHEIYPIEWENTKIYFNNKCVYCGLPIEKHFVKRLKNVKKGDFHKDHVIDDGRNDIKNLLPACESCNSSKHQKTLNEFYNKENPDYTYKRYLKIVQWLKEDYKLYILPKRRYKGQHLSVRLKEIEQAKNKTNK